MVKTSLNQAKQDLQQLLDLKVLIKVNNKYKLNIEKIKR